MNKWIVGPREILDLERRYKFFYFLRDIGIASAAKPAKLSGLELMVLTSNFMVGG